METLNFLTILLALVIPTVLGIAIVAFVLIKRREREAGAASEALDSEERAPSVQVASRSVKVTPSRVLEHYAGNYDAETTGVFVADPQGTIIYANDAARMLFDGRLGDDATLSDLSPQWIKSKDAVASTGDARNRRGWIYASSGKLLELLGEPSDNSGDAIYFCNAPERRSEELPRRQPNRTPAVSRDTAEDLPPSANPAATAKAPKIELAAKIAPPMDDFPADSADFLPDLGVSKGSLGRDRRTQHLTPSRETARAFQGRPSGERD